MAFKVTVAGTEPISLGKEQVKHYTFRMNTPEDSNARSTDVGCTMTIKGNILASIGSAEAESAIALDRWAQVPAERADSYRSFELTEIAAGQVVRKVTFPNAFIVSYRESFADDSGNGQFELVVRQKKDKTNMVHIEGGFAGE